MELGQNLERIHKAGLGLAAISYDSTGILKDFAARHEIAFPLLSDSDSTIIRAFGILNESVKPGTAQYGIPYPGTYIVDRRGKVLAKYFEQDYRERVSVSDILAGRYGERMEGSRASIQAKHVGVTTAASTALAHSGHHILLSVELELGPKMHVYAPGVVGYIPIDWQMEETGAAKPQPAQYPAAQKMLLKPIHETALVYRGRVRITREIVFAPENALKPLLTPSGELVLKGSLRYQACDDRECYVPETVPLEWRFRFEPLDRVRVPAGLQHKAR